MKKTLTIILLLTAFAALAEGNFFKRIKDKVTKPQFTCPVMGGPINKSFIMTTKDTAFMSVAKDVLITHVYHETLLKI